MRVSVLREFIWLRERSKDGQGRRKRAQTAVKGIIFGTPPPRKGTVVKNLYTKSERQTAMRKVTWAWCERVRF